jgi:hypothetical protein
MRCGEALEACGDALEALLEEVEETIHRAEERGDAESDRYDALTDALNDIEALSFGTTAEELAAEDGIKVLEVPAVPLRPTGAWGARMRSITAQLRHCCRRIHICAAAHNIDSVLAYECDRALRELSAIQARFPRGGTPKGYRHG